jgi:hypothetical protein
MYAHKILVANPNGTRLIGGRKCGLENVSRKIRGWKNVDLNQLAQDRQAYMPV